MKVDVLDPGWLGEEFDDAWSVGCEPLEVGEREQYVRWLASVSDIHRTIFGCFLGAAGVLVVFFVPDPQRVGMSARCHQSAVSARVASRPDRRQSTRSDGSVTALASRLTPRCRTPS